ncbi:alpha/beta fold hydrolase [Puerhibacterium sp. TATVAM-FAB25]|uniref:alpha/beta fold hydrolase n=1 Tax=Puerhibacterium sp. TATVAM-FAB25 TaxID=3093699 RepID=UPI00397D72B7
MTTRTVIQNEDVSIAVTDRGGDGPAVVLLHGLAGSSRELLPTADALTGSFRVLLVDQRGHGDSTRRPADLSRRAFVDDVVTVIEHLLLGQKVALVGQSMGAHTAFLTASARPDLVDRLVMLEGHVAGNDRAEGARELGAWFASWPTPFADVESARAFLGASPLAQAWIDGLECTHSGLRPRFDPDVMERTIAAVHEPRWTEWESLTVPTLAVFAEHGMFTTEQKDDLIRRRPGTRRTDIPRGSHDAHLDAFDAWVRILRDYLGQDHAAR